MERRLIAEYEEDIAELLVRLKATNLDTAVALASLPEHIRGFGHIKLRSAETAREKREALMTGLRVVPAAKAA